MEHNEDLARLEQFVEKLVDSHNQLKKEKNEILVQVQEKQQEIAQLQEMLKSLLIDRIGEWEQIFDQEGAAPNSNSEESQAQNLSNESATLFNVATEQPS